MNLNKLIEGSAREIVKTGNDDFIKNLSDTKRVAFNHFQNWKFSLLKLVENKISKSSSCYTISS